MRIWRVLAFLAVLGRCRQEFKAFVNIDGVCVGLQGVEELNGLKSMGVGCYGQDLHQIYFWESEESEKIWGEFEGKIRKIEKGKII